MNNQTDISLATIPYQTLYQPVKNVDLSWSEVTCRTFALIGGSYHQFSTHRSDSQALSKVAVGLVAPQGRQVVKGQGLEVNVVQIDGTRELVVKDTVVVAIGR